MSLSPILETLTPLLVAVGLLWGAIIRIFVSMRRERARLSGKRD